MRFGGRGVGGSLQPKAPTLRILAQRHATVFGNCDPNLQQHTRALERNCHSVTRRETYAAIDIERPNALHSISTPPA